MESESQNDKYSLLVVDDESEILQSLYRLFRKDYEVHTAENAEQAMQIVDEQEIHLVISDMRMPEIDGSELLSRIKIASPNSIRILLTGYADLESTIRAINDAGVYSYVAKPWDNKELKLLVKNALGYYQLQQDNQSLVNKLQLLNRSLEDKVRDRTSALKTSLDKLSKINQRQRNMLQGMISTMYELVEGQTQDKTHHANRVAGLARVLAERLGVGEAMLTSLHIAALLHETGKIKKQEQGAHPYEYLLHSEEVLSRFQPMKAAAKIVRHLGERFDGKGFPDQLKANETPQASQIISLVKGFDTQLTRQDNPQSVRQSLAWLSEQKDVLFNGDYVEAFKTLYLDLLAAKELDVEFAIDLPDVALGMVLSQDLVLENGSRLLSKGWTMTENAINKLHQLQDIDPVTLKLFVHYPAQPK